MSTPSEKPTEKQVGPFVKPTELQVGQWYEWVRGLRNNKDPPLDNQNPFDPSDKGGSWDANNNNGPLIWLAAVTATTEPAYKESDIPNLNAIIAGAAGRIVYNDGKGNPVQKLPPILPRVIPGTSKNKIDNKDLYIPVSTELATAIKYAKVAKQLSDVAKGIIDKEEEVMAPPAFVEFVDAAGKQYRLNGPEVKAGFRVNSTKDISFDVASMDNVFMLPPGEGAAAFSDYAVILEGGALKPGKNTLKFGLNAKFFRYTVEYTLNV
jgi:hypothetical protein